jgi:hypothetical protein
MRFVRHFLAALGLLATSFSGISLAAAPVRDARSIVVGRQKIREELAAAMAKGYITRMEQHRLLLHAKESLSAEDLQGFQRTLDRIATRQAIARTTTAPVRDAAPVESGDDESPRIIATSRFEELAQRTSTSGGSEPSGGRAVPTPIAADSTSVEEVPAGIGQPTMQLSDDGDCCGCEEEEFRFQGHWLSIDLFSAVEGFKGPLDVSNANGNFGVRTGVNGAVSVLQRMGVGLQAGMASDLSNLKGSPYPFPNAVVRDQIFTTVGVFQRINRGDGGAITWGFVYDWLFDDYYANFHFGQWRVKGEYAPDADNAFGIQASLPEHGSMEDTLLNIDGSPLVLSFKPVAQGSVYWTHTFSNYATLTGRFGVAERPGNFVFGGDGCVPVTRYLALTGGFTYIMPNLGASDLAQTQEMWNVSVGMELRFDGFRRCGAGGFRPFIPVADNGSFALREVPQ